MKQELINEILKLTERQSLALKNEDIDDFIMLTEEKQKCINQINSETDNCNVLDDESRVILIKTAELDKKNQIEFKRQFEEVKYELRKIRELRKRDTVYSNPYDASYEEGIFFDKK